MDTSDPTGLTGHDIGLAVGESLAHLHFLVARGRAAAAKQDGVVVFAAWSR